MPITHVSLGSLMTRLQYLKCQAVLSMLRTYA